MTALSTNLWTASWLRVETLDGKLERVSFAHALREAHRLRGVADTPLGSGAILRWLIALATRGRTSCLNCCPSFWSLGGLVAPLVLGREQKRERSARAALTKPLFEGGWALARAMPGKDAGDAQIFVQVGPVDEGSVANDLEILALGGGTMPETRIPDERRDDRTTVGQVYSERIFADGDILGTRFLNFND